MSQIEQEYKEVSANLKQVSDQLKAHAEKAEKDIKAAGVMGAEAKAAVDKLLLTQSELNARLQTAEQAIVAADSRQTNRVIKSLGQAATSEENMAAFAKIGSRGSKHSIEVPRNVITSGTGSGGELIVPDRVPGIVVAPQQRLTIRDLINFTTTTSNSIEFVRESGFTNNANVVSENPAAGKPESNITFEADSAPVATIAHWIHATRQVLSDASMLAAYIDGRLRYGLKLKEEAQLLKGSGAGLNINGIYTQASAYANPGVVVQHETMLDRLRIAMLQVQLAEYAADGIVLNPIDWATIELNKDANNNYLFANIGMMATPSLWGRPIVESQSMDVGDYLTGAFRIGAQGYDRDVINVAVSTEDRDNFIQNMVTILCEERVALAVYRPEAFVKGDFTGLNPSSGA